MITTLLFDLDGTLVDSRADLASAVNHVLKELGYPAQKPEEIIPKIGNGLRRLLMDTIGLTDPDELKKAKDIFTVYYDVHCVDETEPYPDVASCLKDFSKRYKMAVITNKPQPFAEKILREFRLDPYIQVLLGGDSLAQAKPDPLPLLDAIRSLGTDARDAIMVGDGIQDIQAGTAASVQTCLARYGFGFRPELLELRPDYVIDKFVELRGILK